jgi:hypothetical protein
MRSIVLSKSRKVQILERAETMGDVLTRRTAAGKRQVWTVCRCVTSVLETLFPGSSAQSAIMFGVKQIEFFLAFGTFRWLIQLKSGIETFRQGGPRPTPSRQCTAKRKQGASGRNWSQVQEQASKGLPARYDVHTFFQTQHMNVQARNQLSREIS